MLSVKAEYENGKLILPEGIIDMPVGRKKVIVTFLEEENNLELHPEWEAEIKRRVEAIDNGTAKLIPGEDVFKKLRKKY